MKDWKFMVPAGIAAFVIGIFLASINTMVLDLILQKYMTLSATSQTFPMWKDMNDMLHADFYFFNLTNMEAVRDAGAKPELQQIGPYKFFEQHHKFDITWNDNGTVTYKQRKVWKHVGGDLDDLITVLNIPYASVGDQVAKLSEVERALAGAGVAMALPNEEIFVTVKVREFLFEGYDDPLLDAASKLEKIGIKLPGVTSKFGFFFGRNDTWYSDGITNVFTGSEGLGHLGRVHAINFTEKSKFFDGKCGAIKGSADFFPPYLGGRPQEFVFNPDLCRTLVLTSTGQAVKVHGTSGDVYVQDASLFANSSVNPDNLCFDHGDEIPSGLFDASACRFKAPVFMSQPHFYQADPYYASLLQDGSVEPNKTQHGTQFVFEPTSGVPLDLNVRLQVNIKMQKIKEIPKFKNLPKLTYMPVMWTDYHMNLQEDMVKQLWYLGNLTTILIAVGGTFIGIGAVVVLIGYFKYTLQKRQNSTIYGRVDPEESIEEVQVDEQIQDEIIQ